MYAVLQLHREATATVQGVFEQCNHVQQLKLSWIEGQIGAIPVFDSYEDAQKYAASDDEILKLESVEDK